MKFDMLTVMPDFCSSGIWAGEDKCMVDHEELGLPEELIKEFDGWIEFYDRKCHETRHYTFKAEMAKELNNRGRELSRKLKAFYPDITVYYKGEVEGDMLDQEEITGA